MLSFLSIRAPALSERSRRMFTLVGHLPWLARFILLIPGNTNALETMKRVGRERAITRKKEGTKKKDLFYYLVSIESFFLPLSVEI